MSFEKNVLKLSKLADRLLKGTLKVQYFDWYYSKFKYSSLIITFIPFVTFMIGIFNHLVKHLSIILLYI